MKRKFFFATDPDSDCYAIYDENRNLVVGWQSGDDISRVFTNFFTAVGFSSENTSFSIDGGFPDKI
jgi:hypothetical protein